MRVETRQHRLGRAEYLQLLRGRGGPDAIALLNAGERSWRLLLLRALLDAAENAPGCEDPYDVESWKRGERHTFCETYLIPADARNVEVHWSEEDAEPYVWTFPRV